MMSMHTVVASHRGGISFKQNMLHRETVVEFCLDIDTRSELFRFTIPFAYLDTILRVDDGESGIRELVLSLPTPPRFFRKLDEKDTHEPKARYWAENLAWFRQTDITNFPAKVKDAPITIKKPGPIIDIGKFSEYIHQPSSTFCFVAQLIVSPRSLDHLSIEIQHIINEGPVPFSSDRARAPRLQHSDSKGYRVWDSFPP